MNDEVRQIHDETFNRIILGLVIISLAVVAVALVIGGVSSAWFIRAVVLFIATIVALVVRFASRLMVASYVLVLELLVLGSGFLLRSGSSFAPYIFIPIVLMSGLLLSPTATLVITAGIVVVVLIFAIVAGQFTTTGILLLLPSLGITVITALLAIQNKRNVTMLGQRLLENRTILRERTLETMETLKRVETLQQQVVAVEKQLRQVHTEAQRGESAIALKNSQLYTLMQGAIKELNTSVRYLERSFEELSDLPYANGYVHSLETIWQRIYRLKAMLINLEEMAKIEHGDIKLEYDLVDVGQLVAEVAGTAKGLVFEKNIEIRTQLMENIPMVQADPTRLRQVLLHMLNNAIKYTDSGTIEIGTNVEEDRVIIQVSDTGIGMHREETEQIFEKFNRGESTLAQQRQGGGLGLAISKQLINLQGGRMWVSSVLGVGTTFYIALPAKVTSQTAQAATAVLGTKTTHQFDKVNVPVPQTDASSMAALQTIVDKDDGATMLMPKPSPSAAANDDGATVVLPDPTQKKTQFSNDGTTLILRKRAHAPRQPRSATGPVQRFMPFYIQRFGYILLSLLLVVVVTVASLATAKYLFIGDTANATLASSETVKDSGGIASSAAATRTPTSVIVAFSIKSTPTPLPTVTLGVTEIAIILPPDTPTEMPPTTTPTTPATATPTPEPSATPLPPTATPSPLPTSTNTPLPTNTPTIVPATPVESTASRPLQLLFAVGQQFVSGLSGTQENEIPLNIAPDANSRVSKSNTGQVVFAATNQSGSRDIFVSASDGASPVNITNAPGDDMQPVWAPDGQRMAFSSGRTGNFDIFVAGTDGSNPVQLTNNRAFEEWPAWSLDGSSIAFVSDRDGNVEVYIMNADGSNQRRLTNHPADDWPAAWSPDGRWLVFASNRDGDWNLYVIRAEGGPAFRLTNAPGAERDPIWSPDGRTIAFVFNGNGNFDVYTLPVPTGTITEVPPADWIQITNTPTDERYPVWETPDSQLP